MTKTIYRSKIDWWVWLVTVGFLAVIWVQPSAHQCFTFRMTRMTVCGNFFVEESIRKMKPESSL